MNEECELTEEHRILLLINAYSAITAIGASTQAITQNERANARAIAPLIADRLLKLLGAINEVP